jgi:lipid-A-disaccharide synthase-like uncharacterized protein
MNTVLGYVFGLAITPWKLAGYTGVSLFAGRWVVCSTSECGAELARPARTSAG